MGDEESASDTQNSSQPEQPSRLARAVEYVKSYREKRRAEYQKETPQDRAARRTAAATIWIAAFTFVTIGVGASQFVIFWKQLGEMQSTGQQTDDLIKATKKSADAAKQSADSVVALERPSFFVLVKVEGAVSKDGPFESTTTPTLSYTITNMGRVPGILRTMYAQCYLQRGKFPEHPIIDTTQMHLAQNAIAAGLTGTGYPPCQFEKPFSKQDWLDIASSRATPVYTALLIYEGPLDYTYVDTVSYRIDPFNGGSIYPLGLQNYTNEQTSQGRVSKGANLDLPNITWKPEALPQQK